MTQPITSLSTLANYVQSSYSVAKDNTTGRQLASTPSDAQALRSIFRYTQNGPQLQRTFAPIDSNMQQAVEKAPLSKFDEHTRKTIFRTAEIAKREIRAVIDNCETQKAAAAKALGSYTNAQRELQGLGISNNSHYTNKEIEERVKDNDKKAEHYKKLLKHFIDPILAHKDLGVTLKKNSSWKICGVDVRSAAIGAAAVAVFVLNAWLGSSSEHLGLPAN